MKELVTQQVVEYLEGSLSAEDSKAMRAQLEVSPELRAQEQGMRRVLQAENLAAVSEAELPDAFEDAVMRRLRVTPPPQAHKNLG